MFGNLAALSWCTSHSARFVQLQLGTMGSPIGVRCGLLSCISYICSMREWSVFDYRHLN